MLRMNNNGWHASPEMKVGVFFLVCLAIFAYVWFAVVGIELKRGFDLTASFRTVTGLINGAPVQIAGIKVGSVKDIRYDPKTGRAIVVMEIKGDYEDTIPDDSRLMVKTKGLLGDKYLVIEPGRPNAGKLKPGDTIKDVREPLDTEKVIETIGVAAADLQALTREARKEFIDKKGTKKLGSILSNSDTLFADMKEIISKNKKNIDGTLKVVNITTKNIDSIVARNKKKINETVDNTQRFSRNLDRSGDKFEKLTKDAGLLVRDLRQISSRVQSGPGTVSRLINDPELYYEARRAVRNMNKTAEDVSEATPISTMAIILGSVLR